MKIISITVTAMTVAMALGGPVLAQGGNRGWSDHSDFRRGGRVAHQDWDRGQPVDYRAHHLRRPSRGYEWREVNGNYVMAAVATGVIASMIMSGHH